MLIRKLFLRNINATTNINRFTDQSVMKLVEVIPSNGPGQPRMLRVHYDQTNHLFQDLSLLMNFDERKPLQGNAGSNGE